MLSTDRPRQDGNVYPEQPTLRPLGSFPMQGTKRQEYQCTIIQEEHYIKINVKPTVYSQGHTLVIFFLTQDSTNKGNKIFTQTNTVSSSIVEKGMGICKQNRNSPYSEDMLNHNSHGNVEEHNVTFVNHNKVLQCCTVEDKILCKSLSNNYHTHRSET